MYLPITIKFRTSRLQTKLLLQCTVCGLVRHFSCYKNITVVSKLLGKGFVIKRYNILTSGIVTITFYKYL